ncbi:MAG: hypothetical protein A3B30_02155 [Candidatus Komeilibacteria bacterium RIFCSPLOWO2_01_FULL_52_15]|uniref:DUF2933 domain-containing protein n=2 Tax=Candidatus Komeiliibacteriota TaxID=1817908 RepID=A0A1G2BU92_9BACT|nr:MAG: hypothetical protein A2677_00955 [Candidatus Komeilibacteria bacterium RIFCSPHIGHO2_01_FULL_52_14]OGY92139.1 MAG: hypothetical protein A3B30_02155 [Candidatus Komeilibacteria bacterium RIFCSPLOWO2_01_FULL_52_15]
MDHQHNKNDGHDMRMMWMMMLACMLPVIAISFASSAPNKIVIALVITGAMVALHLFFMRGRGHQSDEKHSDNSQQHSDHDQHTGCH